jgi:thioredoxin reductase (NADPH)
MQSELNKPSNKPSQDSIDPSDPYERKTQMFPRLSAEQIDVVRRFGEEFQAREKTVLFSRGEKNVDFFVVLSGCVEIFQRDECGTERVLALLENFQFTGELHLFNNRQILVGGRVIRDSLLVRVHRADFRRMLAAEPEVAEIIMRAFILRRMGFVRHSEGGVLLAGVARSRDMLRIRQFLLRNYYPHRVFDTATDPDAQKLLSHFSLTEKDLPAVIGAKEEVMKNPDTPDLAAALGLLPTLSHDHVYDVIIAGAGPAGLAAAVYAASEGLDTLILDPLGPGGQAGTSSRIENYLGFPNGISGQDLAARAQVQAEKFGAQLAVAREVIHAHQKENGVFELTLCDQTQVQSYAVVVASGARYRKLDVPGYEQFEGKGIHYAATAMEAQLCVNEEIVVVGGGNSAGQAAVYLSGSGHVSHVHMLVRSQSLAASMSSYLVERILASTKITLHYESEMTHLDGLASLEEVQWKERTQNRVVKKPIKNLFVMIGAEPNTTWLKKCLTLDSKGFVLTGKDQDGRPLDSPYSTVHPGIFAVGDVCSSSIKRVAAAVGEGSVVIQWVHHYLNAVKDQGKVQSRVA